LRSNVRDMRKRRPIDALLPKTRQAILAATLPFPERSWYLTDLAKHLGVAASSLQRELGALVEAGIFERRPDGNRIYFRPHPQCPFMPELRGLIMKTIVEGNERDQKTVREQRADEGQGSCPWQGDNAHVPAWNAQTLAWVLPPLLPAPEDRHDILDGHDE
jgi:hypothetical protein